jgi:hypothetical protein|nr:MAG TPA: tail fiber protein [Caudoviricetes sp.]
MSEEIENKNQNQVDPNIETNRPQDFHNHGYLYGFGFGYPYFNGQYEPWYDDRKDYNTNAPSYYDYLSHRNYNHHLIIDLLNRVARRNLTVTDTSSIDLTKTNDWISEDKCNNYHDIIDLKADVKLSKKTDTVTIGNYPQNQKTYTFPNGTKIYDDGVYSRDITEVLTNLYDNDKLLNDKIDKEIEDRKFADNQLRNIINNEITTREKEDNKIKEMLTNQVNQLNKLISDQNNEYEKLKNTVIKMVNNLRNSGAWEGDLFNGGFKPNRNIATGNINIFGGTPDGDSFIRTNNSSTENDLAGGV